MKTDLTLNRTVSELTSDFAYVVRPDPGGRLLVEEVPETFTRITGYTPGEVGTFDRWETIVQPDDVPIFHQHLQTLLSDQSCVSELRILTKSGQVRWLRVYGQPLWDEGQERVARIYGAVQDITAALAASVLGAMLMAPQEAHAYPHCDCHADHQNSYHLGGICDWVNQHTDGHLN